MYLDIAVHNLIPANVILALLWRDPISSGIKH